MFECRTYQTGMSIICSDFLMLKVIEATTPTRLNLLLIGTTQESIAHAGKHYEQGRQ